MRTTSGAYSWVVLFTSENEHCIWASFYFLESEFLNKKAKNIGELILQYVIIMLDITLPGYKYRRNKNPKKLWKYMYIFVL